MKQLLTLLCWVLAAEGIAQTAFLQSRALWASINGAKNASLDDYQQHTGKVLVTWRMLPGDNAATGFDHALFFLRGLHKYGATFDGAAGRFGYQPIQTPLKFERMGNGGLQNRAFMFVHYKDDRTIETVNY